MKDFSLIVLFPVQLSCINPVRCSNCRATLALVFFILFSDSLLLFNSSLLCTPTKQTQDFAVSTVKKGGISLVNI